MHRRRVVALVLIALLPGCASRQARLVQVSTPAGRSLATLETLAIKGRAPKTGYARAAFGPAWSDVDRNGCDTRNDILRRDLSAITFRENTHGCVVVTGELHDPYTAKTISFIKAHADAVQIDHVVSLSDAWQKGAFAWPVATRLAFANDPRNLLAVDGRANQAKRDGDAATWLPPNKAFRCAFVTRQITVKAAYDIWVTQAERDAMVRVLKGCATSIGHNSRRQGASLRLVEAGQDWRELVAPATAGRVRHHV